jgi:hypothetical protein
MWQDNMEVEVANHTVMWQDNMEVEVADRTLMWQVNIQVVEVAQWFPATWPSHGLPCGNGNIPNEGPRTKFQK